MAGGKSNRCLNAISPLILSYFLFLPSLDKGNPGEDLFSLKSHNKRVKTQEPLFKVPPPCLPTFRLSDHPYKVPFCNGSTSNNTYLQGDFSSSAEFFVCVGVFGFLYCTATLILYLGYQHVYRQTSRGPIIVSTHPPSNKSSLYYCPLHAHLPWVWGGLFFCFFHLAHTKQHQPCVTSRTGGGVGWGVWNMTYHPEGPSSNCGSDDTHNSQHSRENKKKKHFVIHLKKM